MVPRKPTPDGKRIPLSVKVSETKVAEIDEARGDMTLAAWLAAAIDCHLEPVHPILPPDGFEDVAAVAQIELQKAARADFLAKALPPRRTTHAVTCKCGMCRPSR